MQMFLEFAGKIGGSGVVFSESEKIPAALTAWADAARSANDYLINYAEEGGDFLLGPDFSMAEVMVGPMVMRLSMLEAMRGVNAINILQELGLTRLVKWIRAVQARPSVSDTTASVALTPSKEMLETFKSRGIIPLKVSYEIKDGKLENVSVLK
eukprot:gnl/MRDRNA2_/MRDRNA2_194670_c0_seq1.p1 gnl/MRDRNA2_/MRDRNA2_194670_c0~~gnl/MRDRNA2_/MRDRNA2_194670_c0_seq1.p1  ORF type:complete len:154 (+),score=28.41 gnl/MRDRNA2_/MRDRNA2_194670_c0_seq1:341-802(+)